MADTKKKTLLILVSVYAAMCIIRFLLALASSTIPTTIPDEFLYYSIARSLAEGKGALFYGQQADYSYCLYPMVLSVAYLLPKGTDYFRVMQILNILIMNLSIFPVYALGKSVLKDEKKSIAVAIITVLLPDFILAQRNLSESLIYPLFFLMLWLAYSGENRRLVFAGIIGGILFSIKPGHIVAPFVLITLTALSYMKNDRKKGFRQLISGLAALLITAAVLLLLNIYVINPGVSLFSIYEKQLVLDQKLQAGALIKGAALSPNTFLLAAGVFPVLIPMFKSRRYSEAERILLYTALISVAAMMLGTAWVVNRYEYKDPTVHTRYIAMFIPVLFILLYAVPDDMPTKKKNSGTSEKFPLTGFAVFLILCVLPELVYRYDGGMNIKANIISNYALSWLRSLSSVMPENIVISILLAAALCGCFLICRTENIKELKNWAVIIFVLTLAVNNIAAYSQMAESRTITDQYTEWTEEIRTAIGDEKYIDIIGDNRKRYDAGLDVNNKDSRNIVFINDLFNNTVPKDGIYEPFLPDLFRGDIPDRLTDEADLLLFDRDAVTHVEFSDDTAIVAQNDLMTLVRITPGKRWADSMLGGPVGTKLSAGTNAFFVRFDGAGEQTLVIDMTLAAEGKTVITTDSLGSYSFDLPAGRDTYKIRVSGDQTVLLYSDADIEIHSYRFE